MPLFYPIRTDKGERALLNMEQVFCYVERDGKMIAIGPAGSMVEIQSTYDEVVSDIEEATVDVTDNDP